MQAIIEMTDDERRDTRELIAIANVLQAEGKRLLLDIGKDILTFNKYGYELTKKGNC